MCIKFGFYYKVSGNTCCKTWTCSTIMEQVKILVISVICTQLIMSTICNLKMTHLLIWASSFRLLICKINFVSNLCRVICSIFSWVNDANYWCYRDKEKPIVTIKKLKRFLIEIWVCFYIFVSNFCWVLSNKFFKR